jgi:predicted Na+-dependent transporter
MSFASIRDAVNRNFSLIISVSFFLGLYLPFVDRLPSYVPAIGLGAQLFFSCFRLSIADTRLINPTAGVIFYLARFIVLPALVFLTLHHISPDLALCIFFFLLLPPGTSTPGIASIVGGNVSLSLFLVTLASLLTPLLLPLLMTAVASHSTNIDTMRLFLSTTALIVIPVVLHLPVRINSKVTSWIQENNPFLVIPTISLTTITAIAKQRTAILDNIGSSVGLFALSCVCYGFVYFSSWYLQRRNERSIHLSYCLASGTNNITLGLVLALLNFPSTVISFMALSHASWIATLILFKKWTTEED